jgi:two-component sensor histidine kinase
MLDTQQAIRIGLIVNELATNALKHAFPGDRAGTIQVGLQRLPNPPCGHC